MRQLMIALMAFRSCEETVSSFDWTDLKISAISLIVRLLLFVERVERTFRLVHVILCNMHVGGSRLQALVPEKKLNYPHVHSVFEKMRGKRMTERMRRNLLLNAGFASRNGDDALHPS